ncbi:MAG TPA: DUF1858 domain-containing protein [Candidatus Nealsonbacteria bacterium]|uniref:DUF1858 domain-containing protein n=1 Tax=marine sediment metagenome TaxID=412755 RepID=A0A0F9UVJ8_9ZZZZ|nr:DUF1858 domain-containing protein [Candidatus Nealsonbacteria bacterium]HEB46137.1 DUF1858 domain-containing protein [Candidatus Nealsonbacteria bacterium]
MEKITKEMTIKEIAQKYPETASVFIDLGLYCFGCPIAQVETIEEMAKAYRFDLKKILEDLNKTIKTKKNK